MGEASMRKWMRRARREINPYGITVRPSGIDLADRAAPEAVRATALHMRRERRQKLRFNRKFIALAEAIGGQRARWLRGEIG